MLEYISLSFFKLFGGDLFSMESKSIGDRVGDNSIFGVFCNKSNKFDLTLGKLSSNLESLLNCIDNPLSSFAGHARDLYIAFASVAMVPCSLVGIPSRLVLLNASHLPIPMYFGGSTGALAALLITFSVSCEVFLSNSFNLFSK